jgi:transposase-like protein
MDCICVFQACRLGERLKGYPIFSRETIHVAIWDWIQKYKPQRISYRRRKITEYIVDETFIKVGSEHIWLWVVIEPKDRETLALTISKGRNTFVAERFISGLVHVYREHSVSTDKGTWYPQACRFLRKKTPSAFSIGEKLDREDNAVHKGQDQKIR